MHTFNQHLHPHISDLFVEWWSTQAEEADPDVHYPAPGALETLLEALSDDDLTLLLLRMGIVDGIPWTYDMIANQLPGTSLAEIKAAEIRAIRRLNQTYVEDVTSPDEDDDERPFR